MCPVFPRTWRSTNRTSLRGITNWSIPSVELSSFLYKTPCFSWFQNRRPLCELLPESAEQTHVLCLNTDTITPISGSLCWTSWMSWGDQLVSTPTLFADCLGSFNDVCRLSCNTREPTIAIWSCLEPHCLHHIHDKSSTLPCFNLAYDWSQNRIQLTVAANELFDHLAPWNHIATSMHCGMFEVKSYNQVNSDEMFSQNLQKLKAPFLWHTSFSPALTKLYWLMRLLPLHPAEYVRVLILLITCVGVKNKVTIPIWIIC